MKKVAAITLLLAIWIAAIAIAGEGEKAETSWFDMKDCEFCKHLTEPPDLLDHCTWELHDIDNGVISIGTVEKEYKPLMDKANAAMMELGEAMQSGKRNPMEVKLCGHCQAYGALMMMPTVKFVSVKGDAADVDVITSDDPAGLAAIRNYAEKTREALADFSMEEMK